MSEKLERITEWEPAFDKRNPDPKKNYGIHGATMRWVLKGPKGAIQFVVYTNWMLPHVTKEQIKRSYKRAMERGEKGFALEMETFWQPMAADWGYHSRVPMYEGQEPMGSVNWEFKDTGKEGIERYESMRTETGTFTPCQYLDGAPCYYDGSGLYAEEVLNVLITQGGEAVWKLMEESYHERFAEVEIKEVPSGRPH